MLAAALIAGVLMTVERAPAVDQAAGHDAPHGEVIELHYGFRTTLVGNSRQILALSRWINHIARTPVGRETLWTISRSGHDLTIYHSRHAVLSSGRAGASMTRNLFNGKGEDVYIKFNADIPDQGSHWVFDGRRNLIEYTAAQNLYHELVHARQMMTGTWRYFDSEGSAIRQENVFRHQLAELENRRYAPRASVAGVPICPDPASRAITYRGQELIC